MRQLCCLSCLRWELGLLPDSFAALALTLRCAFVGCLPGGRNEPTIAGRLVPALDRLAAPALVARRSRQPASHQAAQQPALPRAGALDLSLASHAASQTVRPAPARRAPATPAALRLIDELLSAPPGSEQEAAIWGALHLDRYRGQADDRAALREARRRRGAHAAGRKSRPLARGARRGLPPRDPAKLQAGLAVLAALVQEVERAQRRSSRRCVMWIGVPLLLGAGRAGSPDMD